MKKILGGCLVVVIVAMIGLGVALFYAYRYARPMIDSAGDYLSKAKQVSEQADRIANRSPYIPPPTGELTNTQVERFVAVQGRVRDELGDRWSEIETKSAEIRQKTAGNHELSFGEITSVFKDIANIYVEARRVQVNALNIHKFSDAEYTWVRRRVYEAAGVEMASGIDMSAIESLAREGAQRIDTTKLPDIPLPKVPDANIQLVKPHAARVKDWIPMAVLGL